MTEQYGTPAADAAIKTAMVGLFSARVTAYVYTGMMGLDEATRHVLMQNLLPVLGTSVKASLMDLHGLSGQQAELTINVALGQLPAFEERASELVGQLTGSHQDARVVTPDGVVMTAEQVAAATQEAVSVQEVETTGTALVDSVRQMMSRM